jgi:hypothetical protein
MGTEKDRMVVGVGCFAARDTLARVLRRTVESYILGKWDEFLSAGGPPTEGTRLLNRLMAHGVSSQPGKCPERVTGFHLLYKNHRLDLCVFSKNGGAAPSTFNLDELTRIRQKRLN